LQPLPWDLDEYRRGAERFLEEIDREYYLHLAGHKPELELEAIYERHEGLFGRDAVDRIGETRRGADGEEQTRLRYLHQFALDGYLGAQTRELIGPWNELGRALCTRFLDLAANPAVP
jgi:hypothetical protein